MIIRHVVGIGEILWDLLPSGKQLGGGPVNFASHVYLQGVPAAIVGSLGADALGLEALQSLNAIGIGSHYLISNYEYPTGTVSVTVGENGSPSYVIHEGVAWDHLVWTAELGDLAASARAICFGTLSQRHADSRVVIQRFLQSSSTDCIKVCDINLRQNYFDYEIVSQSLTLTNVLKLNDEELPVLAGMFQLTGSYESMVRQLISQFSLDLVALTCGGNGSMLFTANESADHLGIPAAVVDTVGAGDAFTAALVVGLLDGKSLDEINESANRRAAEVCGHAGAVNH